MDTESATVAEREAFWASVAFCNFVQDSVGTTCDDRPQNSHYRSAVSSLPQVLDHIQPQAVLILGIGQSAYSRDIVRELSVPFVVAPHPTGWGVETATLKRKWQELQQSRKT